MPVTIGPFTNVPAPGDPVRSDWPQSISTWVAGSGFIGGARAKIYADTIGITTDVNGVANVNYPAGMFTAAAVVIAWNPTAAGAIISNWIEAAVEPKTDSTTGFVVQLARRGTNTGAQGAYLISYIAIGGHP